MSKYYALKKIPGQEPEWIEVDGMASSIVPWLQTFWYSEEDQDIEGKEAPFDIYHVCESRSGFAIATELTKFDVLISARRMILATGRQTILKMFNSKIIEFGFSPLYKELFKKSDGTYSMEEKHSGT